MEDRENCHEALLTSCDGLVSCLMFFIHTFFFFLIENFKSSLSLHSLLFFFFLSTNSFFLVAVTH